MMEKLLMSFAVCALILTSCNKNEVIENIDSGNGQLTFSPAIGKQTRAAEVMNSTLIGTEGATSSNPIKLYAYQNTGTWGEWFDDGLYYDNSKWQISSTRFRNTSATKYITFWPRTDNSVKGATEVGATFTEATFTGDKFPEISYTASTTNTEQVDLIAGITDLEATKTDVVFKMRHLLSQVNFGTKGYEGAKIRIGNIQVVDINETAAYTFLGKETEQTAAGRIGAWGTSSSAKTYPYTLPGSSDQTSDLSLATPETASTGDLYIFGDGGNWGPGSVKYLSATNLAWRDKTTGTKLSNSLMLIPQSFVGKTAKVTFDYTITDKDGAYVAGTAAIPDKGEFKLDFTSSNNTDYASEWKQNMRYVYIIDFTDFLDGNKLTFDVDVEAYEWENYNNGPGDPDNGIVDVSTVYQPTSTDMNTIATTDTWMVATRTKGTTAPSVNVQLVNNQTWDWTLYDFAKIAGNTGDYITIDFTNVIFNGKAITLAVPLGYTVTTAAANTEITVGEGSAVTGGTAYVISKGDQSKNATIIITNTKTNYFRVESEMKTAVGLITASGTAFTYTGTTAVDLTGYTMALTTDGNTLTIDFSRSTVTPTVGATADGNWTWNAATKTATYTKVTWKNLSDAKTDFAAAAANGMVYCSDATNINMTTEFDEPTGAAGLTTGDKVTVVFNAANASRVVGAGTTNGTWTTTDNKTYTWTTTDNKTYTWTTTDNKTYTWTMN